MHMRPAALAACVAVCCAALPPAVATPVTARAGLPGATTPDAPPESADAPVTLEAAFRRVDERHPDLRLFGPRQEGLAAALERASLRPALVAGASVENAFGTGAASGLDGAELTLTLASVLERGGKLDARRTLALSRIDGLAIEREARRLDLLAEVARRYLAAVAAGQRAAIAQADIRQRQRTVAETRRRHEAGASPESVVLTAEAAQARAEVELARAMHQAAAARQHLAALWGEQAPTFEVAPVNPLQLPSLAGFATLAEWLQRTPEILRFADERRIAEARLQLARSEAVADLDWQIGVRRLEASDDFALVAGLSLPLGARDRALPDIRAAEAELALVEVQREAAGLSLYSTLAEAHGRYAVARLTVARIEDEVLPRLALAEAASERAYRAGAASYLEWSSLQGERTAARTQQLDAALDAQRALIEIQRLTGQAFLAAPAAASRD